MNLHTTGNSAEKNRKWPKLAMLATGALLLSAISFIGIGAIPQQAFAQNVDQSVSQAGSQAAEAAGNITQSGAQSLNQGAVATGNVNQDAAQSFDQFANSTGP